VQSQKMEAIGRITGGVAHDFNNLLTVILGNLLFLKRRLTGGDDSDEIKLIDKISAAAQRGSDLNKRLLSFSREQALKSMPEDMTELLPEMQDFLARILGDQIELELQLPEGAAVVMLDRAQFENAMVNLCLNARDAMPHGGKVVVGTEIVDAPRAAGVQHDSQLLQLTVTESGAGIDPDITDKIFDPFFTTKPPGEGSGLGLSTTYGFVQQSGGNITVNSEPGKGAKFVLQFPLAQTLRDRKEKAPVPAPAESYSGTILVVEDDADILDIAREGLLEAGYNVLVASNGRAGLEKFQRHPEIDLVFSDIMMPGGLNGIEMAQQMISSRPNLQILLATGYTQKILKDRAEEVANIMCISKPYDIDTLPGLINSLMQKAA
ncbi:MAG: response regulator, partial [Gammaproteobacteria bacterium]